VHRKGMFVSCWLSLPGKKTPMGARQGGIDDFVSS
jgi:hypothetical protein